MIATYTRPWAVPDDDGVATVSLGRPWEPLRRALDDSPALVAIMSGPAHVFEYTNASYDEFSGRAAVGRPVREVFPELEDQEFFALLDQVYSSGESVRLEETPIRYLRPGATEPSEAWLTFTYSPLISDGVVTGVMCIAVDVTGVVLTRAQASETAELAIVLAGEAEVATGAASRLQAVTGDLTRALGVDDVLETVLAAGLEALEASSAHVALVDDASGMLQVQDLRMTTRPLVDVLALDADAPLAASVRTARPIFLGTPAEIRAAFPAPVVADNLAASGEEALVVVPLTAGDRVLGVLRFGIEKPSSPPAPVRSFMLSLANHCAVALERAQLAASAQHAWGQLQVSESRYRTLVEAMSLDVWRADPSGALVTDMPAWRELTGGTRDVRGDAWLADVHPEDQARVVSHWMRCVREQRFYDSEYRIRARDGWRRIRARGAPLRSSSGADVIEWIGTTDDVTAEHLAVDRALALQRIAEALVAAATVADVEAVVLGLVREIVQARAVVVGLLHAETGAIPVRTAGYPADLGIDDADGRRLPLLTDAIRTGRARFIPDAPALREALTAIAGEARTADLFDSVTAAGDVSWCMLPLISRGTPSGGITLGFAGAHSFDAAERTFLLTIAANCAVALQRAQLFEEQRTVATVLQRALQPLVVEQPAFGSAWVEQRTAAGADVGGDWAEVL
ncbi:MAG: hypothetical protein QOK14_1772, partial [Frankiaceae bacterium]|nr:hypothetical protein [Frankiaceae bacterium]